MITQFPTVHPFRTNGLRGNRVGGIQEDAITYALRHTAFRPRIQKGYDKIKQTLEQALAWR